ncbi:MAG: hypothetical protein HY286_14960 [Planctomycetes bacterium]|nr:hypothetical protein [Planctomycetota bacterium]
MTYPRNFLLLFVMTAFAATPANAFCQGKKQLGEKAYEDKKWGYSFVPLDKWNLVPPEPTEAYMTVKFVSPARVSDPKTGGYLTPECHVYRFDPTGKSVALLDQDKSKKGPGDGPTTGDDGSDKLKELREKLAFKSFDQMLAQVPGAQRIGSAAKKKYGNIDAQVFDYKEQTAAKFFNRHVAVSFQNAKDNFQIVMDFEMLDLKFDEWRPIFEDSFKSFKFIKTTEIDPSELEGKSPLEKDELRHKQDCERTHWLFAKTEHYFIKYDTDKKEFIDQVKERIEAIRKYYVDDFGKLDQTEYPVLRICKSMDEYHQYGGSGSSAGFFNSATKELVIPNLQDLNINLTWAVMNHEAFHQFIHYKFGQVDPHSWYNEGTGDYYAGYRYQQGGKYKLSTLGHWAGGLDRVEIIKDAVKKGISVPLEKLLRFSQGEYYNGPSTGQSYSFGLLCYSEGWSLIYFLRQGKALGHTPWKPEWEKILKDYFDVLNETKDRDKAVETAFKDIKGDSLKVLEDSWKEFVRKIN